MGKIDLNYLPCTALESLQKETKETFQQLKDLGASDIIAYRLVPGRFGNGWRFCKTERPIPLQKLQVPTQLVMNKDVVYITAVSCVDPAYPEHRLYAFAGCTRVDMFQNAKPKGRLKAIGMYIASDRLLYQIQESIRFKNKLIAAKTSKVLAMGEAEKEIDKAITSIEEVRKRNEESIEREGEQD